MRVFERMPCCSWPFGCSKLPWRQPRLALRCGAICPTGYLVPCRAFGFDAEPTGSMGPSLSASLGSLEAVAIQDLSCQFLQLAFAPVAAPVSVSHHARVCAFWPVFPAAVSHCSHLQISCYCGLQCSELHCHMPVPVCAAMFKPGFFYDEPSYIVVARRRCIIVQCRRC